MFGLSYRTNVGNDVTDALGYKIHILYNVTALPKGKDRATYEDDVSFEPFEWDISATPEEIPGIRPTAHYVVDSRDISEPLLTELEETLYGSPTNDPYLPLMANLVSLLRGW